MNPLDLIVNAVIPPTAIRFKDKLHLVSGTVLKAVLLTLWHYDGRTISYRAVGDRAGCSGGTVYRAVHVLSKLGIVTTASDFPQYGSQWPRKYRVHLVKLLGMQATEPLNMKPGPRQSPPLPSP